MGQQGTAVPTKIETQKKRLNCLSRFLEISLALVPAATAISAITTVSATTITTVSTATTTAAATISTATTAAAFALFHRTRLIDGQRTTIDFLAVEFRNGCLRFFCSAHFHETESTGTTRHAIIDHLHPRDIARLGEEIGQVVFRHAKGQVAHIEFYAHYFLLGWLADVSGIGSTLPLS
jgi:hypothetical protein